MYNNNYVGNNYYYLPIQKSLSLATYMSKQ